MSMHWIFHSWVFYSGFPPFSSLGWFQHGIPGCLPPASWRQTWWTYHSFFTSVAGFFVFVEPLRNVLLEVFLEYFTLFCIVSGAMHQECFVTGRPIALMSCMGFLDLVSAAILGIGWWGGFYYLMFPDIIGTVGICPGGSFRRCSYFVEFLRNLHALEHLACFLVALPLKSPAL